MRIREAIGIAAGAATLTATAATGTAPEAAAAPVRPPNFLAIDRTGHIAPDGTITLTGTYRCAPLAKPAGTVYIGSNIRQSGITSGIGGSIATCDGKEHRWRNDALPYRVTYRAGTARADGMLLQFKKDKHGIPLPHFIAVASERDITLVAGS
ncbi:DUF6299 family protein [Streptomyces griseocarneus]|uniref:DUF6299 family protein n=1 Tax=Streptomyces griseocarneus TaxID=51201 RepID=UPI00167C9ECD|nr:DUF6299 family protein [Streptomyces griseocarneus]MBZ6476099.1 DUF6299 family protein [Streptomyces griseocarneus]GHG77574.1 hypothetical protein GCM10018779_56740 [Streptomyces griseocarneus]